MSREGGDPFGKTGVLATAVVSGLADVDAITLSVGRLALEGGTTAETASLGIVLTSVTNTFVKLGIAWVAGTPKLGRTVAPALLVAALGGFSFAPL